MPGRELAKKRTQYYKQTSMYASNVSKDFEQELKEIISESRNLALNLQNGFISSEHFFVAMLNTECRAKKWLSEFEPGAQLNWLREVYVNHRNEEIKDTVPLTIFAERMMKYTIYLASISHYPKVNSLHLLLSMLSYENRVSELLQKKGIIFDDIATEVIPQSTLVIPQGITLRRIKLNTLGNWLNPSRAKEKLLNEILEHGWNLFGYQQYEDCITNCQSGLALNNEHSELRNLMAYCLIKLRRFGKAIEELQWLTDKLQENTDVKINLAFCLDNEGRHAQAIEILDEVLIADPRNIISLNNKGFSLNRQEKFEEAIPIFENVLQLEPDFAFAWNNLGFAKFNTGQRQEGLALIDKSLLLDKGNAFAYRDKGIVFMEQQDRKLALENFQLALKYQFTKKYGNEVLLLIDKLNNT